MNAVNNSLHFDDNAQKASPKLIGKCDDCSAVITTLDPYLKLSDSIFCQVHACMLSEVIEEIQISVDQNYLMEFYGSLDMQKQALEDLQLQLKTTGDRKFTNSV